jgi:Beta-lactamase class C and other penicillin binding proteins
MQIDEETLDQAIDASRFSGVVAIDTRNDSLFERSAGFANRAFKTLNNRTTRFAMASGSKVFTAVTALSLVDAGSLTLDTRVRTIVGSELPSLDPAITVEHLLSHSSGMSDYLDDLSEWKVSDYLLPAAPHVLAETSGYLPQLARRRQRFLPGNRFSYCDYGFILLALVMERVTGLGFHDLVRTQVLQPAGLTRTDYLSSDELPSNVAIGYLDEAGRQTNVFHLPARGNGDGGCYTTVDDLRTFWRALLAGKLISSELVAEMIQPRWDVPELGLRHGLGVWLHPTEVTLIADGCDAGVSMRSIHCPRTGETATVLGNTSEGAKPVAELLLGLFD